MATKRRQDIIHISETFAGGKNKREFFDWKMADQPGEFAFIKKEELHVDDAYQRSAKRGRVMTLAAEWSWIACGAISVALRGQGEWFVMDGQHRVLAAMLRDDIKLMPCMVFGIQDLRTEAKGFLNANTNRGAMTMVDRFKALLASGDPHAELVRSCVEGSGRRLGTGGHVNSVSCVSALLTQARDNEPGFRRLFKLISELCSSHNHPVTQDLVVGIFGLEKHLLQDSLTQTHWSKRLMQVGPAVLMESIRGAALYHGSGKGVRNCALGVANAINKGLRNKLEHKLDDKRRPATTEKEG